MLRNYLKIALRSLRKKKVYTTINVVGLAVSVGACLLIVLYVREELSYDSFFSDGERIYKMAVERKYPTHATFYSIVPHSYAQSIQRDFPEVENVLQLFGPNKNSLVTYKVSDTELKSFEEDYVLQTDSSFFKFFDLELVKGDKRTALALPNQILVSESAARKYFGSDDPIGKLLGGDVGDVKVTGVFKDVPDNSHLRFDFLSSLAGEQFNQLMNQQVYTRFDSHTYIKLKPGSSFKSLEDKFPKMVDNYASSEIERDLGKSWTDYKKAGNGYRYFLQPLTSIHLDSRSVEYTITPSGNIQYIFIQ